MSSPQSELQSIQSCIGSRYHLLELLGKKSGRRTLLALDQEANQRVVIKLLTFGEDFAWDDLKLFEREAETLRSLDHSSIPRYLDFFDVETERSKGFALVQSYIAARSLSEQMEAGRRFSENDLVAIAQQLLDILDYLHNQSPPVIHRDIKPSNILLTDHTARGVGQLYLVDFGSVQTLAAREGSTMTVVGTYGYMPPEQFGGRTVPASDLYALGATLIYLGSGYHPADLPQENFRIQFENAFYTSRGLKEWLRGAIAPSLEQRFQSAQEAHYYLQELTFDTLEEWEDHPDSLRQLDSHPPSKGLRERTHQKGENTRLNLQQEGIRIDRESGCLYLDANRGRIINNSAKRNHPSCLILLGTFCLIVLLLSITKSIIIVATLLVLVGLSTNTKKTGKVALELLPDQAYITQPGHESQSITFDKVQLAQAGKTIYLYFSKSDDVFLQVLLFSTPKEVNRVTNAIGQYFDEEYHQLSDVKSEFY